VLHRLGKKGAQPVIVVAAPHRIQGVLMMPGVHGEEMPDGHLLEVVAGVCRSVVREELQHRVVEAQEPFIHCNTDRGGREALAQRVEHVGDIGFIRRPPSLGHHIAVAQEHETLDGIQRVRMLFEGIDEGQNGGRWDSLGLRGPTREDSSGHRWLTCVVSLTVVGASG
jgi:hypothetical protein